MLFTIGYEKRSLGELLTELHGHEVDAVVDVREVPISRKPSFSKARLAESLQIEGIGYVHMKPLGSPSVLRKKLKEDGDFESFRATYVEYLQSHQETLARLYDLVREKACCLICYERAPERCHRSIVSDQIKLIDGNGLAVNHIA